MLGSYTYFSISEDVVTYCLHSDWFVHPAQAVELTGLCSAKFESLKGTTA